MFRYRWYILSKINKYIFFNFFIVFERDIGIERDKDIEIGKINVDLRM